MDKKANLNIIIDEEGIVAVNILGDENSHDKAKKLYLNIRLIIEEMNEKIKSRIGSNE